MINLLNYEYEGAMIPFTDDAYVNLTTLCARFGKRPLHFLELESTKEYIAALAADTGLPPKRDFPGPLENVDAIIVTVYGGNQRSTVDGKDVNGGRQNSAIRTVEQGTWAHPDLAMECARWLSPRFSIWCNRIIRSILSGKLYHTAGDKPLHKTLERGIEVTKQCLNRKRAAYWEVLHVPGNLPLKVYLKAIGFGFDINSKDLVSISGRLSHRSRFYGSLVGKTRIRRDRRKGCKTNGGGFDPVSTHEIRHLHAEIEAYGFKHEIPTNAEIAAVWYEYEPGPSRPAANLALPHTVAGEIAGGIPQSAEPAQPESAIG